MKTVYIIVILIFSLIGASCKKGLVLVDGERYSGLSVRLDGAVPTKTNKNGKFPIKVNVYNNDGYIFHVYGQEKDTYGLVDAKVFRKSLKNLTLTVSAIVEEKDSTTIELIEAQLKRFERYLDSADITIAAIEALLNNENPLIPGEIPNLKEHNATVDAYREILKEKKKVWKAYANNLIDMASEFDSLEGKTNTQFLLSSLEYFTTKASEAQNFYNSLSNDKQIVGSVLDKKKEDVLGNILFGLGKYDYQDISLKERRKLDQMCQSIKKTRDELGGYSNSQLILVLKLIGSADGAPMGSSIKRIYQQLEPEFKHSTPLINSYRVMDKSDPDINDEANYYLSVCRAISIGTYITEKFPSYDINIEIIGKGRMSSDVAAEYRNCSVSFTFITRENEVVWD